MNKKRLFFQFLTVIVIVMALVAPVAAAENIVVSLTPKQGELRVGDPVELTLAVTHPAGYQVIIPQLEQNWGPFEVRAQSQATTVDNGDNTSTTSQTLTVTLFNVGTFETPTLPLTISDSNGQLLEEVVPPVSLTVIPTLAEGDTELMDIRPQVGMEVPAAWPMVLAGTLALVVVAIGGWWLYRRRRGQPFFAQTVDNRSPYQVAFDALDQIDDLDLPNQGQFKEHYTLVTDVLRLYIEQQFQVHAFDRTTTELKQSLQRSTLSPEHIQRVIEFFFESDLVKFAKFSPTLLEARQLTKEARILIDLTRPIPVEEEKTPLPLGMGQAQKAVEVSQ
jgi:hypothetical protein